MWLSIIIFAFAYVTIATGKLHKTVAAVLAGCVLIALGGVSQEAAYREIDLNVIFLLLGMMLLVNAIAETGFFQWVALSLAKKSGGRPITILLALISATAVLSAFLDNVTTILLIAPVTVLIADELELNPVPFLIMEALSSNIGGTATMVGDPPNIVIGSRAGLSFNQFIWNLGPVVLVCFGVTAIAIWLFYRGRFHVPEDVRARLRDANPAAAITNRREAVKVLTVAALVVLGFFLHGLLKIEPSVVALSGGMVALLITKRDVQKALAGVEWPTLMFFVGLFILVAGLDERNVLKMVADALVSATRGHFLATVMLVLWGSAVASAFVDNIPFVAAMIPVIKAITPEIGANMGLQDPAAIEQTVGQPLWWALALGACLGGNATLVGASANVIAAGVAEKHGHRISFVRFLAYGVPTALASLVICSGYMYLRYFLLAPGP